MTRSRAIKWLRKVCLAFPEAAEKPFGGHTAPSFRVREKIFVMMYENETSITVKGALGAQDALVGSDPDRFFVPPYSGPQGWVGIRLDAQPDLEEVAELIEESYRLVAPKRLVAQLETGPSR